MQGVDQIRPMLAVEADLAKLKFPLYAGVKYDGIRAIVIDSIVYSRSLKPIRNKLVQKLFGKACYNGLDGELVVGDIYAKDVFQKTTSGVMGEDKEEDVKFYVFDSVICDGGYAERKRLVQQILDTAKDPNLVDATAKIVSSREEIDAMLANEAVKGGEGLILRYPEAVYKYGRSTAKQGALLKVKFFEQDEFQVVDFVEQMENTNEATVNELGRTERSSAKAGLVPKGTLGALVLQYGDTTFNCGTGFNDALRKEIWENQDKYLGKLASVRYMTVGAKDLPRVPSFQGFRDEDDLSA